MFELYESNDHNSGATVHATKQGESKALCSLIILNLDCTSFHVLSPESDPRICDRRCTLKSSSAVKISISQQWTPWRVLRFHKRAEKSIAFRSQSLRASKGSTVPQPLLRRLHFLLRREPYRFNKFT